MKSPFLDARGGASGELPHRTIALMVLGASCLRSISSFLVLLLCCLLFLLLRLLLLALIPILLAFVVSHWGISSILRILAHSVWNAF
jgi:hypothetical protein